MNPKTILSYLQEQGRMIQAPCQGNHQCGKCKMKVTNRKLTIDKKEEQFLTQKELNDGYRLACFHHYKRNDDIVVDAIEGEILQATIEYLEMKSSWQEMGCGIVVDIGTTTVVMQWLNLQTGKLVHSESFYNPQSSYGSDVISRISYDTSDNKYMLHDVLVHKMEEVLVCCKLPIKQMVVVGNATMIHLFLKLKTTTLGISPFTMIEEKSVRRLSTDIFTQFLQVFEIITLPHISAFVGSDIVSGIVASNMDQSKQIQMLIDLGTNGELAMGNSEKIVVTATAAGPAFEGVNMECGGPSVQGAIYQMRLVNHRVHYKTIGNVEASCICGSGIVSAISELLRHGYLDEIGRFKDKRTRFYINDTMYISSKDIQAFQLAKAAIQTGITLLSKEFKTLDIIYLAGGFGSHIDIEDLITLGIIDEKYQDKICNIKNSALRGGIIALLSKDIKQFNDIVKYSKSLNLAKHPDFNDTLIESLYFYD